MKNYPYICLDCYEEIDAATYDTYKQECPFCTSTNMQELTPEVLQVTISTISDIAHKQGCTESLVKETDTQYILTTTKAEYTINKTDYRTLVRCIGELLAFEN